jgi:cytochrome c biogenesis protein CcmG/thiol:disulfide interchange protein DsbE
VRRALQPRRLLFLAGIVLAFGAVAAGVLLAPPGATESSRAKAIPADERERAPELDGEWLVGPPVRVADLRGEPALINVWASWCVPCREEAPELARFDREMRARARLVGIDIQDAKHDALAFIREFGWRFPNVRDPNGTLAARYGVVGLPTTYVIDPHGRIAQTLTGAQTFEKLVRTVEEVED